jgi:DNA replicative helicase MCM subunit Mcm2 (Cdc46/Mcm family)
MAQIESFLGVALHWNSRSAEQKVNFTQPLPKLKKLDSVIRRGSLLLSQSGKIGAFTNNQLTKSQTLRKIISLNRQVSLPQLSDENRKELIAFFAEDRAALATRFNIHFK